MTNPRLPYNLELNLIQTRDSINQVLNQNSNYNYPYYTPSYPTYTPPTNYNNVTNNITSSTLRNARNNIDTIINNLNETIRTRSQYRSYIPTPNTHNIPNIPNTHNIPNIPNIPNTNRTNVNENRTNLNEPRTNLNEPRTNLNENRTNLNTAYPYSWRNLTPDNITSTVRNNLNDIETINRNLTETFNRNENRTDTENNTSEARTNLRNRIRQILPELVEITLYSNNQRVPDGSDVEMEDVIIPTDLRSLSQNTTVDLYQNMNSVYDKCSICRETLCNDSIIRKINTCEHLFHMNCIDTWLETNTMCPICRNDLRENDTTNNDNDNDNDNSDVDTIN